MEDQLRKALTDGETEEATLGEVVSVGGYPVFDNVSVDEEADEVIVSVEYRLTLAEAKQVLAVAA